jgi:SAM-dependent methyltransferase
MKAKPAFSDYATYYDLLYRDKDYAAEAQYVHDLIQRFKPGATRIIELGSGTGRHAILLVEKGYSVRGVERSTGMISSARKLAEEWAAEYGESKAPVFVQDDIRSVRIPDKFDVVISLFHVISYQTTNDDLLASFQTARAHLLTGGLFIFDVWYGPAVLTARPSVRIKRVSDDQTELTRLAEPRMLSNEDCVEIDYHVFLRRKQTSDVNEIRESHKMRYLFMPEIEFLAAQTAFASRHAEEWMTGHALGDDTWGACFVLQAI